MVSGPAVSYSGMVDCPASGCCKRYPGCDRGRVSDGDEWSRLYVRGGTKQSEYGSGSRGKCNRVSNLRHGLSRGLKVREMGAGLLEIVAVGTRSGMVRRECLIFPVRKTATDAIRGCSVTPG